MTPDRISPEAIEELLTLGEAGQILGVSAMTIHRMAAEGLIDRADPQPVKNRQITRSSVDRVAIEWGRRLSQAAAAAMLGCGIDKVAELLRTGVLTRHRYGPAPISIDEVQELISTGALSDPIHRGRVPTREAATKLGLSNHALTRRAKAGQIAAAKDRRGTWWFRSEHVEAYRRSRVAQQTKMVETDSR
jgi:hypothetical protein